MEAMSGALDLAAMAAIFRASGRYRVQRRLEPRRNFSDPAGSATRTALFVDVETTGLALYKDEIIELAMVPFTCGADGRIFEIYFDRAPQNAGDRKGHWFLKGERALVEPKE